MRYGDPSHERGKLLREVQPYRLFAIVARNTVLTRLDEDLGDWDSWS